MNRKFCLYSCLLLLVLFFNAEESKAYLLELDSYVPEMLSNPSEYSFNAGSAGLLDFYQISFDIAFDNSDAIGERDKNLRNGLYSVLLHKDKYNIYPEGYSIHNPNNFFVFEYNDMDFDEFFFSGLFNDINVDHHLSFYRDNADFSLNITGVELLDFFISNTSYNLMRSYNNIFQENESLNSTAISNPKASIPVATYFQLVGIGVICLVGLSRKTYTG